MFKKLKDFFYERRLRKFGYRYRIGNIVRYGSSVVTILKYYEPICDVRQIYVILYSNNAVNYAYDEWLNPLYEFKLDNPKELSRYLHMKLVDDGTIQT